MIELSTDVKDMQNEYDSLEESINEHTNSTVWEDKQANKEYLALMRIS